MQDLGLTSARRRSPTGLRRRSTPVNALTVPRSATHRGARDTPTRSSTGSWSSPRRTSPSSDPKRITLTRIVPLEEAQGARAPHPDYRGTAMKGAIGGLGLASTARRPPPHRPPDQDPARRGGHQRLGPGRRLQGRCAGARPRGAGRSRPGSGVVPATAPTSTSSTSTTTPPVVVTSALAGEGKSRLGQRRAARRPGRHPRPADRRRPAASDDRDDLRSTALSASPRRWRVTWRSGSSSSRRASAT